jgi:hypothetical protein
MVAIPLVIPVVIPLVVICDICCPAGRFAALRGAVPGV